MMKTDLDTFLKFIDQTGEQKHFRTVEFESDPKWQRKGGAGGMNNNLFVYSGDCRLCEVGLETELVDINGQQLHTGDVVVVFTENYMPNEATVVVSNQYQTYQVFEHGGEKTVHHKSNVHKPFIMGLAGVDWSDSENPWRALCIKKYTELIEGEQWSTFNIKSDRDRSEVEVEALGDETR